LIFTAGLNHYYEKDPSSGVGHVGMILNSETVVQAANRQLGVIKSSISAFVEAEDYRGIRRITPDFTRITVLQLPLEREVETSDDIKWILYQNLP
jgi:hypothetical protein